MEPKDLFSKVYGENVNDMTPVLVEHGWILKGVIAYEISASKPNNPDPIYGVTVVGYITAKELKQLDDLMGCFLSLDEAKVHVEKLKRTHFN